jgi:hypothetical protein
LRRIRQRGGTIFICAKKIQHDAEKAFRFSEIVRRSIGEIDIEQAEDFQVGAERQLTGVQL